MRIDIRTLDQSHAEAFQGLRLRGLREHPAAFASSFEEEFDRPLDAVRSRLTTTDRNAAFGAFIQDGLVGLAGLYRETHRKLEHRATLWGVYVAPEYRRGEVGRVLIEHALGYARDTMRVRQVVLGVGANNAAAIALYRRVGFEPIGIERDFIFAEGKYHDELHMIRFLREPS